MGTISMSRKERKRLEAFSRVKSGGMTLIEASERLALSYRQTKRAWSRSQSEGDAGLVHRLRGRASNRRSLEQKKQAALVLYCERYADYGPTLAAECLAKDDGIAVAVTTLRRWLSQAGLLERRRKRRPHRRRRPRRERRGDLVQTDGSHHDWFEGRRGWAVLVDNTWKSKSRALHSVVIGRPFCDWQKLLLVKQLMPQKAALFYKGGEKCGLASPVKNLLSSLGTLPIFPA